MCPDFFFLYFIAAMLTHADKWLVSDASNAAVTLEAAVVGSFEALRNILYRGPGAPHPLTISMKTVLRAWSGLSGLRAGDPKGHFPNTPLWLNPSLPEFYSIPDPIVWASKGI